MEREKEREKKKDRGMIENKKEGCVLGVDPTLGQAHIRLCTTLNHKHRLLDKHWSP